MESWLTLPHSSTYYLHALPKSIDNQGIQDQIQTGVSFQNPSFLGCRGGGKSGDTRGRYWGQGHEA